MTRQPPRSPLFPYPTLFRSARGGEGACRVRAALLLTVLAPGPSPRAAVDRRTGYESQDRRRLPREETGRRSEEHTSELQSHVNLVCRLLLEKKKKTTNRSRP